MVKYYSAELHILPLVDDIDGDEVRCRWARGSDRECAGVCAGFPDAVLNEVLSCTCSSIVEESN